MPGYLRTRESWTRALERRGRQLAEVREPADPRPGEAASLILVAGAGSNEVD